MVLSNWQKKLREEQTPSLLWQKITASWGLLRTDNSTVQTRTPTTRTRQMEGPEKGKTPDDPKPCLPNGIRTSNTLVKSLGTRKGIKDELHRKDWIKCVDGRLKLAKMIKKSMDMSSVARWKFRKSSHFQKKNPLTSNIGIKCKIFSSRTPKWSLFSP